MGLISVEFYLKADFVEQLCSFKIESKCLPSLIFSVVDLEDEAMDPAITPLQVFSKPEVLVLCLTAMATCYFALYFIQWHF